ncbi:putative WD repeat-containing protein [Yarrowia sp. E02]|nr:putative WD repeat-containing protein [Yarrowia sp. E02]
MAAIREYVGSLLSNATSGSANNPNSPIQSAPDSAGTSPKKHSLALPHTPPAGASRAASHSSAFNSASDEADDNVQFRDIHPAALVRTETEEVDRQLNHFHFEDRGASSEPEQIPLRGRQGRKDDTFGSTFFSAKETFLDGRDRDIKLVIPETRDSGELSRPRKSPVSATASSSHSGSGFFSRILQKRKNSGRQSIEAEEQEDDEKEEDQDGDDKRAEGWCADVMGYAPNYSMFSDLKYVKVRAHHRPHQKKRNFDHLFLAQELRTHDPTDPLATDNSRLASQKAQRVISSSPIGAIWAMKFSLDGRYLAAAGQDRVLRVWKVCTRPQNSPYEDYFGFKGTKMYAPVFEETPEREFRGHEGDILDLSWSKNNFLISSSMDKTVRLWHPDRQEEIASFPHNDFVTCVEFHPKDDRFFVSGSMDRQMRLWSILDKQVAFVRQVPDIVTAVAFTPNGNTIIAGCLRGQLYFYQTHQLVLQTQLQVRISTKVKHAYKSKITGIQVVTEPKKSRTHNNIYNPMHAAVAAEDDYKMLITTNDSRIRLYNYRTKALIAKYRGLDNDHSQIKASFSDDYRFIISGSEGERTYVWDTIRSDSGTGLNHVSSKTIKAYEYFHSHQSTVTVALFAPLQTRQLLDLAHDPIYSIVNPPKVVLGQNEMAPEKALYPHHDGHIIVAADYSGKIKVFRQDSAYNKRKLAEDSASFIHSRRSFNSVGGASGRSSPRGRSSRSSSASAWNRFSRGVRSPAVSPGTSIHRKSFGATTSTGQGSLGVIASGLSSANHTIMDSSTFPRAPRKSSASGVSQVSRRTSDSLFTPEKTVPEIHVNDEEGHEIEPAGSIRSNSVLMSDSDEEVDEDTDQEELTEQASLVCEKCGSQNFKVRVIEGMVILCCSACRTPINEAAST